MKNLSKAAALTASSAVFLRGWLNMVESPLLNRQRTFTGGNVIKLATEHSRLRHQVQVWMFHDGLVYFVKNGGILTCLELETGKRAYRIRARGTGTHYASPIMADGKLFCTAGNGRISVLNLGPKPKILAVNDMGDCTYATPAIVDGTLYVRTHANLFAFGVQ